METADKVDLIEEVPFLDDDGDDWVFEESIPPEPKIVGTLWGYHGEECEGNEFRIFNGRPVFEQEGDDERVHLLTDRGPYQSLPYWKDELDETTLEKIESYKVISVTEEDEVVIIGPKLWDSIATLNPVKARTGISPCDDKSWHQMHNGFYVLCMRQEERGAFLDNGRKLTRQKIKELASGLIVRGKTIQELFALYEIFSERRR